MRTALTTAERGFIRVAAPMFQRMNTVTQNYALERKGSVSRDFSVAGVGRRVVKSSRRLGQVRREIRVISTANSSRAT